MSARRWQDGNFYCNITTFDHTKPYVRELWLNTLLNATKIGAVGGVFADHGWGTNIGQPNADGSATLCNGGGALRSCWNFTAEFSAEYARLLCEGDTRQLRDFMRAQMSGR